MTVADFQKFLLDLLCVWWNSKFNADLGALNQERGVQKGEAVVAFAIVFEQNKQTQCPVPKLHDMLWFIWSNFHTVWNNFESLLYFHQIILNHLIEPRRVIQVGKSSLLI